MIFNLSQRKSCLLRGYVCKYMSLCKLTSNSHILSSMSYVMTQDFTQRAETHLLGATQRDSSLRREIQKLRQLGTQELRKLKTLQETKPNNRKTVQPTPNREPSELARLSTKANKTMSEESSKLELPRCEGGRPKGQPYNLTTA